MLGPAKSRHFDDLVTVSLDSLVPANHFYRHLAHALDLSFVRDWVTQLYATNGRPSIDPVIFFKLQLIMFFEGIWSERQLIAIASLHLAHRCYLGYNLDEPLPDHCSLTRIRHRLGLPIFRRFFDQVVELCDEAGLIWGKELLVDATKVLGNADMDSLVLRLKEIVDDHLVELFGDQSGADVQSETEAEIARDTPALLHPNSTAPGEMETGQEARRWDVLETCRLDPDRPLSQGYERLFHRKVSLTDPQALMIAAGQNLKRYLAAQGWGHRHGPTGSLWASFQTAAPRHHHS